MQTTDGHILCLLRSDSDRTRFITHLFERSFQTRESVLYVGPDEADAAHLGADIKRLHGDIEVRIRSGRLTLFSFAELGGGDGFVPRVALEALHEFHMKKVREGHGGVRFVLDMTFAAKRAAQLDDLLAFESSLSSFAADHSCAVMTLYRLDELERGNLTAVLRAPRRVCVDGDVLDNPYFTPQRDLLGEKSDHVLFNHMLDHIEAKRDRDTLMDNEDLLRTLFREIDVGFVLYQVYKEPESPHYVFQVLQANPILEEINNAGCGELVGQAGQRLFPTQFEDVVDIFTEVALTGQSARFERIQESSGHYFEIIAFRPREGVLAALITDVTDRHKLEETRQKSEFRIRQTQKMEAIGRLASGVAHDFNNILTAIVGLTNVLMEEIPEEHPQWEDVEQIRKAADRAAELTRQLLAFSRKQKISPQVVNLNRVIEDSSKMLSRIIGEDIHLGFLPGKNLKSVKVDPGQIEQILANFAANARDAMPHGGRLIIETKNVMCDRHLIAPHGEVLPGAYVLLTTRDNGIGMTQEVMERIFEPFFTTKEKGKGTGLGLATVYGIVRQSDGTILVHSVPGEGTVFDVYFPLAEDIPAEDGERIRGKLPKGNATVLITEDEDTVRNLTTRILERNGYRVISAANAEEALSLWPACREEVDFLLTDVIMPGLNGLELFNQLKGDKPELRVLYMSGYPEDVIADHGMSAGQVQLLEKPFSPHKLLFKIREILDGAAPQ